MYIIRLAVLDVPPCMAVVPTDKGVHSRNFRERGCFFSMVSKYICVYSSYTMCPPVESYKIFDVVRKTTNMLSTLFSFLFSGSNPALYMHIQSLEIL